MRSPRLCSNERMTPFPSEESTRPLLFILPRLTDSLHPGNGGNPGFNQYDADSSIKSIIRPAFVGFTLLGLWITQLRVRLRRRTNKTTVAMPSNAKALAGSGT